MTAIYHITPISNLSSILAEGGLHCGATAAERGLNEVDIAHTHIKRRRMRKVVPVEPGGVLADYVPFYFAPRSPMLGAIHTGQVQGYNDGQEPILHLVASAEGWTQSGLYPVFTDGHAIMQLSEFFNQLRDLNKIDWPLMKERYWHDTDDDNDRKRRREAEFLANRFFPWHLIVEIGVMNNIMARRVNEIIGSGLQSHRPVIATHYDWYY